MKKKIIGILVCMLLIATAVPAVTSVKNSTINTTIPNTPQASMAGIWTEGQKLLASDSAANDAFGIVALDGNTALIGAPGDDGDRGSVYFFTRTGKFKLPVTPPPLRDHRWLPFAPEYLATTTS